MISAINLAHSFQISTSNSLMPRNSPSNEQAAQIALIENTHREALNPIAEALAMKRLSEEFHYTHDEIGVLLGVSRAQVTNYLRLLTLEARVQHWMKQGALSAAHGKILAGVKYEDQYAFAYDAISKSWSVHVMDKMIKAALENTYFKTHIQVCDE